MTRILRSINLGFWYLRSALKSAFGERTFKVSGLHKELIECVLLSLDVSIQTAVKQQLRQKYFFSFMTQCRVNVLYFFDADQLELIKIPQFQDARFTVELHSNDKSILGAVTFYRGRIFSVELPKPRKFFRGKDFIFGRVSEGPVKDSITNAIDRLEHGKSID
jgi:hypothetical protein